MYPVPFPLSPSLWSATAIPAPSTRPLLDNHHCDVAVIGGGFAGLSTALHLAEKGVNVTLLEAKEIGFGASGRNGGQVIPGLKYDPDELIKMFGNERGQQLVDFAGSTADVVFDLIARHQMDVPLKELSNGVNMVPQSVFLTQNRFKICLVPTGTLEAGLMSARAQCSL